MLKYININAKKFKTTSVNSLNRLLSFFTFPDDLILLENDFIRMENAFTGFFYILFRKKRTIIKN